MGHITNKASILNAAIDAKKPTSDLDHMNASEQVNNFRSLKVKANNFFFLQ